MSDYLCYEIKPTGEFRICVPPERLSEIVSEIIMRDLAVSVTIGSVEHNSEKTAVLSLLMGATPLNRPAMQTFLRKKDIPRVTGLFN